MPTLMRVAPIAFLTAGLLSACTAPFGDADRPSYYNSGPDALSRARQGPRLSETIYRAVDHITANAAMPLSRDTPVLVATVVTVDDLNRSSTFGRVVSKQVSGRLVQSGYHVRETTLRNALAVRPGTGELMLSRDLQDLSQAVQAQAVLTGTYGVGGESVAIHLELIRADDGRILSAVDLVVPLDRDTRGYLAQAR